MHERLLFGFLPVYGLLIACSITVGMFLCIREEKRLHLPGDTAIDLILYIIPPAIVGARLYYAVFRLDIFIEDPVSIFYLWEGGLAIYGGVLGGAAGAVVFSRRRKIPFTVIADMVAPSLILGQAIGRWGNYINEEAYGYAVNSTGWQFFPVAVFVAGNWHMATFFYEFVWDFAGFFILYLNRRKTRHTGELFWGYIIWYGSGRMIIEGLRTDSLMFLGLRISQILSIIICVIALAALYKRVIPSRYLRVLCLLCAVMPFLWAIAVLSGMSLGICTFLIAICSILMLSVAYIIAKRPRKSMITIKGEAEPEMMTGL